ncbi:MAG: PTS transporter subunit EIIB, partial [Enterococcus thailandicus]|nr:PTS transporter subunit EIIB [Enterococcus thailandicus]
MDDRQRAQAILEAVGGKENVSSLTHCATRLRFYLNNGQKVEKEEIKEVPGVIQYVESGGQHQVVIGSDVVDVFDELVKLLPEDAEKQVNEPKEKQTWYDELFATISA